MLKDFEIKVSHHEDILIVFKNGQVRVTPMRDGIQVGIETLRGIPVVDNYALDAQLKDSEPK